MLERTRLVLLAVAALPAFAAAQSTSPVATAFRNEEASKAKNLIAAAEAMPADHYGYKPTPAQLSFGQVVAHLAQGNDYLCGAIGGTKAPARDRLSDSASKDLLVARLKETFKFCDDALASLDDSHLSDSLPFFGGRKMTRAAVMTVTVGDWADHYSQSAIYLRLNGVLPPTARKP